MDYRAQLSRPLSPFFLDELVYSVFNNPTEFGIIYQLIFDNDEKIAWRAAWACVKISEQRPEWFSTEHIQEIVTFTLSISHGGLHRGCMSILSNLPLPQPIPVDFINACFEWMISPKFPIAVQALSMKMLYRVCEIEPDFIPELMAYLENINTNDYSNGFNSTRNNVLNLLKTN